MIYLNLQVFDSFLYVSQRVPPKNIIFAGDVLAPPGASPWTTPRTKRNAHYRDMAAAFRGAPRAEAGGQRGDGLHGHCVAEKVLQHSDTSIIMEYSMEYLWNIYGISMEYLWNIYGFYLLYVLVGGFPGT